MKNEGVLHTVAMSMYQVAITWGVPIEPALLLLAKSDHRPSCNYLTIRALSPRYHPVNNITMEHIIIFNGKHQYFYGHLETYGP